MAKEPIEHGALARALFISDNLGLKNLTMMNESQRQFAKREFEFLWDGYLKVNDRISDRVLRHYEALANALIELYDDGLEKEPRE